MTEARAGADIEKMGYLRIEVSAFRDPRSARLDKTLKKRGLAAEATLSHRIHFPEHRMIEFLVDGMSCGHCVNAVTQAVHAVDPAAQVDVDLSSKHVRIASDVDGSVLAQAIADAGYMPEPLGA